jgi:dTDP-4-amino-4,6-dideoxygalactose transaminase
MLDLKGQYKKIKKDVDESIQKVIDSAIFINGKEVLDFEKNLSEYLNSKHVIACANGTDALQIAIMALELKPGDEVIVPAFTYAANCRSGCFVGFGSCTCRCLFRYLQY